MRCSLPPQNLRQKLRASREADLDGRALLVSLPKAAPVLGLWRVPAHACRGRQHLARLVEGLSRGAVAGSHALSPGGWLGRGRLAVVLAAVMLMAVWHWQPEQAAPDR